MSDLMIHEFRERAERGLDVPDVEEIQRRGRGLRRRRAALAVGGLALVLLAGGVAGLTSDRTDDTMPAGPADPTPRVTWESGVNTTWRTGEEVLEPGPSEVRYGGAMVRFTAPDQGWEWWDIGVGMRMSEARPNEYHAAVFFLPNPTARLAPCAASRSQALGTDPDRLIDNVAPLVGMAKSSVLREPRVVDAFGTTAVHLQLETVIGCAEYGGDPAQLRGTLNGVANDPGWGGHNVLDLWHVVVPGDDPQSILVASWNFDRGDEPHPEVTAFLESIEIEPAE